MAPTPFFPSFSGTRGNQRRGKSPDSKHADDGAVDDGKEDDLLVVEKNFSQIKSNQNVYFPSIANLV